MVAFKLLFRTSPIILSKPLLNIQIKGCATQASKWDILAAVCVERLPLVTPNLSKIQNEFKQYNTKLQVERSMKSDHEIRIEKDIKHSEMIKKGTIDMDYDETIKLTAQDFEDSCNEDLSRFKPAPIETEADKTNDQTSIERNLQSHLVLVVEQQLGKDKRFLLPQGRHKEGETLRQTAERVLIEYCGDQLVAQIYGNAPTGFYKYKYSKDVNGATGAKVFFYYARHLSGQVKKDSQYKWLNRNELETLLPEKYKSSVNDFLIQEKASN